MKNKLLTTLYFIIFFSLVIFGQSVDIDDPLMKIIYKGTGSSSVNEIKDSINYILNNRELYKKSKIFVDYSLSYMYYKIGEYDEAIKVLAQSEENGNEVYLGVLYIKLGRIKEAKDILNKVITIQENAIEHFTGTRFEKVGLIGALYLTAMLIDEDELIKNIKTQYPISDDERKQFLIDEMSKQLALNSMWPE